MAAVRSAHTLLPGTSFTEAPPLTASQLSSHIERPPDPAATAAFPCSDLAESAVFRAFS